ncbi:MAG: dihydroorotase [Christensenellales bacterium]|nr:dihydroorotase [Christensenellales bacterium]
MSLTITNASIYENGRFSIKNSVFSSQEEVSFDSLTVLPGFTDVHVHFREPGFSSKETIRTGSSAAARGGYCVVCTMPNLNPVPDSLENLQAQLALIQRDACIRVIPYGAITVGEKGEVLADMESMAPYVCAFTDDGRGVQSEELMRAAMKKARSLNKLICAHCEDNALLQGGYIHQGEYAVQHGHRGICSESEWRQIERDLRLVRETGCSYHVCHISTKESVHLLRDAKRQGLDVSCETGPHYLTLTDADLQEDGRFKMNPPLRSAADRDALIEGLLDGTIDMIATDHAPHTQEEKSRGLEHSLMGVVGLETAFPILYTRLVRKGILPLEKLVALFSDNPRKRFSIPMDPAENLTAFDLNARETIQPERFLSKGRSTPFAGETVYGKCILTIAGGNIAWLSNSTEN